MVVAQVMRRDVEFVSPDASIQEAAQLMGELDVGALPVGTRENLQGVVTARDILLRIVASGRDCAGARVRDVMSSTLFTCREEDPLERALETMTAHRVRRLPVVDAQGRVSGWITLEHVASRLLEQGRLRPETLLDAARIPQ